jgi:hypothetical protein
MVGSSMIVEMLSAKGQYNGRARNGRPTTFYGTVGGSESKDSALMASSLSISCGPSEGNWASVPEKGGHYFFDTLLDQRIELLDPPKIWLGKN